MAAYAPLIAAIVTMGVSANLRKRFALPLLCAVYFAVVIGIAITIGVMNFSSHDPELVAGKISEFIVTSLLRAIVDIPILAILFWGHRRWKRQQQKT